MCDCRIRIEEQLTERFKGLEPTARDHKVSLMGYAFIMSGLTPGVKGYMVAEQTAVFPLKRGGEKRRTLKTNMMFTFCPFCGVKYDQEEEAPANG